MLPLLPWMLSSAGNKVYGLLSQKVKENGPGLLAELKSAPSDIAVMFSPQFAQQVMEQTRKPATLDKSKAAQLAMDLLQTTPPIGLLGAIKVYHGSPHKFTKFDISKIGAGEGLQSYGHGLYFSNLPEVAEIYSKPTATNPGYLYEANLRWPDPVREAADPLGPQHFIDWDKPIGKQTKAIQKAINKTKNMLPPNAIDDLGGDLSLLYGPEVGFDSFIKTADSLQQNWAENALKKAGIPGIRFFNDMNYVVFDDALAEIIRRKKVPLKGK